IGDTARLQQAADIIGRKDINFQSFTDTDQASNEATPDSTTLSVLDLGLIPQELPWGQLSPVAGDAAYQYIKVAADMATDGSAQASCTAPRNKETQHAGGHHLPGTTDTIE